MQHVSANGHRPDSGSVPEVRLKVNAGWEPGITWGDKTYRPGETFDIDEDDARQFLDNGSAVEAAAKPKRRG